MRPVDKGADLGNFDPYNDAQQPLEEQLGSFCSYCERWVSSSIHVEHKLPKANYPAEEHKWNNFLLSCPNCNGGKGSGELDLSAYVWPDCDNTFRAFQYDKEGRVFVFSQLSDALKETATSTLRLLNFNKHPDTSSGFEIPSPKDKRWLHRQQAWAKAEKKKKTLDELASHPEIINFKDDAADFAVERGMFSIWMTVFDNDPEMKVLLIKKFTGTASDCFDSTGDALARPNGKL